METRNDIKEKEKLEIKILVVDDREDNLFSIETILEQNNYTIIKANSGRAALKILLAQFDFSLILMDVQMPDLNGFETASIIYQRDRLKNIPIIFITAHDFGDEHIFKGYKMGAVDYIYKPVNPELLRAKVSVFVELYRKNQELLEQEKKLIDVNNSLQKEVNERKASEQRVRLLNEQLLENNNFLKAINEDLDRYAYVASHDLQEPLRKIMMFSDKILQNGPLEEYIATNLQKIVNSSSRMQVLIDDLLRFSRHNTQSVDFTDVDLNNVINEVTQELEVEIEKANADIYIDPLPAIVGIPVLLHQLFYNLLSNAIKYSKKDISPVIQVTAEKIHSSKDKQSHKLQGNTYYHKIIIADNGIGFDSNYAEEIFRVFKRLHSYHEYNGTGIGLSICKKIIEHHNGVISAESEIDKGSRFFIFLPEKKKN
jgi:signal transduction histidine kinase